MASMRRHEPAAPARVSAPRAARDRPHNDHGHTRFRPPQCGQVFPPFPGYFGWSRQSSHAIGTTHAEINPTAAATKAHPRSPAGQSPAAMTTHMTDSRKKCPGGLEPPGALCP